MAVENHLKRYRQSAGLSIAELAREADVSDKTIRKIENRLIPGKVETKVKIVIGLNSLAKRDYQIKEIFPNVA